MSGIVTREQLRQHIAHRSFQPFRIMLLNGETLDVVRLNQAIALDSRLMFATPEDRMRRVLFTHIAEVQVQEIQPPYADF